MKTLGIGIKKTDGEGFEHHPKFLENCKILFGRVINPTQEHAEAVAELLDMIADSDAETLAELLRVAKQTRKPSKASGGR